MATKDVQKAAPATTLEGKRSPRTTTRFWLWLTWPIAFLAAIAAGMGVFIEDLYRDAPLNAAQAVGQDLITMVVALPTLLISAILALRSSMRARLLWLGTIGYLR